MSTALLVIDVQLGILGGPPAVQQPEQLLQHIEALLTAARAARAPVVFVQHDGPEGHRAAVGAPGWPLHPSLDVREGEAVVHKRECDAFYETELEAVLRGAGADRVVVCGLMTQYCIDTTCRRAYSLGFAVTLAADAHGNAGTAQLTAAQVVAHHNAMLDHFGNQPHALRVRPVAEISF